DALRVTLYTRAPRRASATPPSLLWQLHPESGHLSSIARVAARGGVQLASATTIARVHSPPDERILLIELDSGDAPGGSARRIVVELITNQWNALAIGADGRITGV